MSVTVRKAVAADAPALHDLAAATFALACPPGTIQRDIDAFVGAQLSVGRFGEYLANADREVLIAGDFLGYTMLVYEEPKDADVAAALTARPTVELSKCYVVADQHGGGVGSALMAATLDSAHRRGVAAVWLGVNQENGRANRFYEKHGFHIVGTKRFLVGDQEHDDYTRERRFERD
jgi:ribosomal protein S18 acetylase RimI-like enzyme